MLKKLTPLICLMIMLVAVAFTGCDKETPEAPGVNVNLPSQAELQEMLAEMGINMEDVKGLLVSVMDPEGKILGALEVDKDALGAVESVDVKVDVDVKEEEAVIVAVDVVVDPEVTVNVDVNVTSILTEVNVGVVSESCTVLVDVSVPYSEITIGEMLTMEDLKKIEGATVKVSVDCGNATVGVNVDAE